MDKSKLTGKITLPDGREVTVMRDQHKEVLTKSGTTCRVPTLFWDMKHEVILWEGRALLLANPPHHKSQYLKWEGRQ